MIDSFYPCEAEQEDTTTGGGSNKRPCPKCGRVLTWTKGDNPRPYQHKGCDGEDPVTRSEPAQPQPQPQAVGLGKEEKMLPIVIESYITTRNKIRELTAKVNEEVSVLSEQQKKKEAWLQGFLTRTGQESAKTTAGTAFLKKGDSATVADREVFLNFLMRKAVQEVEAHINAPLSVDVDTLVTLLANSSAWNFLTNAISKTEVKQSITKDNPAPPPGVNYVTFQTVQINQPRSAAQ